MASSMEKDCFNGTMAISLMVSFMRIIFMGREPIHGKMVAGIKAIGIRIRCMGMDRLRGLMEECTKVNTLMIIKRVEESSNGLMVELMMVIGN